MQLEGNFWRDKEIERKIKRERKRMRKRERKRKEREIVLGYYTRVTYYPK